MVPIDGPRVRGGTTWGYRGAAIRVLIGRDASEDDLRRDWIMGFMRWCTWALPDMPERYNWLSEGPGTVYNRADRRGCRPADMAARDVWQADERDMPQGAAGSRRSRFG